MYEKPINNGVLVIGNRGQGTFLTEVQNTGVLIKKDNNYGEYEVE